MISRRCQLVSNSTLQVFELTSQLTENTWPATINHTVIITKGALQMRKECIQLIKKVDESRFLYQAVLTIGVVTWPYAHKSFLWASDIFFTYKFTILAFIMFNFHNLRHVYFLSRTLNLPSARQARAFTFHLPGAGKSTNHKRCDAWQVKNWEFVAKSRTRVYFAQHVAATCNIAIEICFVTSWERRW